MMGCYGEVRVEFCYALFCNEGFGHAFVLFLEEELAVQVGELG